MAFTANDVKDLRARTGAGMMDCKQALEATGGDLEAAVEHLRKAGLAKAVSKSGRIAAEGLVFVKVVGNEAILAELNCETDFVAKNEDFLGLGRQITRALLKAKSADIESAAKLPLTGGTIEEQTNSLTAVIGERIHLRQFRIFAPKAGGKIGWYVHAAAIPEAGKIVVVMEVIGSKVDDGVIRDLCMQVAAMNPQYIDKADVPKDLLDQERAVQIAQFKDADKKKPPEVQDKIMQGKLNKFAGSIALLQQPFIKDMSGKQTCEDHLKAVDPQARPVQFIRMQVGEGVEKRRDDFVQEVAKMAGKS